MAKEFSKKFSSGRSYEYWDDGAETMIYYDNYGWAYDENGNYIGYNVMDLY